MPGERIVALDIIRGFALLGILVMNIPIFSGSIWNDPVFTGVEVEPSSWAVVAEQIRNILFDGKFNALFSFLFAVGFTIQLGRLQEREPESATRIYLQRILILFAIGWLHGIFLWFGDILVAYAVLGLFLYVVRNWSNRIIYLMIGVCLVYPGLRMLFITTFMPHRSAEWLGIVREQYAAFDATFGAGSFSDVISLNAEKMLANYVDPNWIDISVLGYLIIALSMLLGLIAARQGWIRNAAAHANDIRRVQWWSLGLGLVGGGINNVILEFIEPGVASFLKPLYWVIYTFARVAFMIFYIATILRLAQLDSWRRWLAPFAAAGRMPLTNYLLQSVFAVLLFYNVGLGYWGKTDAAVDLLLAFGIFFAIQVPLSVFWFRHFDYGPMERLWRWLSYGPARIRAARGAAT